MKRLCIILLLLFPLFLFSQNELEQKRLLVQSYAEAILSTDVSALSQIRPLLKITNKIPEEEGGDGVIETILQFVKGSLQNKPYIILTYEEVIQQIEEGKLRKSDTILHSDKGETFYFVDTHSDKVLIKIPVVVNKNYEIISISIGFCGVKDFCIKYLSDN
ncbi:MAG: hypothetical protein Q3983_07985 [Capnocytophaga sp.]|nr:hypothetical protein [Capnocytophaga sp.]